MSNRFDDIFKRKLLEYRADYQQADWEAMESMLDKDPGRGASGTKWIWRLSALTLMLFGIIIALNFDQPTANMAFRDNESGQEKLRSVYIEPPDGHYDLLTDVPVLNQKDPVNRSIGKIVLKENPAVGHEKEVISLSLEREKEGNSTSDNLAKPVSKVNQRDKDLNEINVELPLNKTSDGNELAEDISDIVEMSDNLFAEIYNENEKTPNSRPKLIEFEYLSPYLLEGSKEKPQGLSQFEYEYVEYLHSDWSFSIGLSSGISFSYLDDNLLPNPGYSVGLNASTIFKNRVGFTSGMNYTQQEYETGKFECDPATRYRCPVYYTSVIKSIEIPLEIRLNYFRKNTWQFFVTAGFSNFIKLEEKFNYLFEPDHSEPTPPRSNPFVENHATSYLVKSFTRDFTLSEENRYHYSYTASLGVEKFIAEQMSITFEPAFQLTGNKVGNKDFRLFSYSMAGSLRFYPGR